MDVEALWRQRECKGVEAEESSARARARRFGNGGQRLDGDELIQTSSDSTGEAGESDEGLTVEEFGAVVHAGEDRRRGNAAEDFAGHGEEEERLGPFDGSLYKLARGRA